MNTIQLTGGLTRDPELKTTPNANSVCKMRLAVTRPRARDKTDYFDVVAWDTLGEICAAHLEKGRQVAVSGRVEYREWEPAEGVRRHDYSVVADQVDFLDRAPASGDAEQADSATPARDGEPLTF